MKKTFCFLLFFLFLMFEAVSGNSRSESLSNQKKENIQLEPFLTLGSMEDDLLFQWIGVTVDLLGNIYVTDSLDYSLKKFSSDGNLLKKRGGRGQGPGEFMAPRLLDASEKCSGMIISLLLPSRLTAHHRLSSIMMRVRLIEL